MFLGEGRDVVCQAFERVVLRADRPDDFIQRLDSAPGRLPNPAIPTFNFAGFLACQLDPVAKECDLCETCTDFVVDILGDACPLAFDGVLPLNPSEPKPRLSPLALAHGASECDRQENAGTRPEPPCLPIERMHCQRRRCALRIPQTVVIARCYSKSVMARRHEVVCDGAPVVRRGPIIIKAFQFVPEPDLFRRGEGEG